MSDLILQERAKEYGARNGIEIDLDRRIGFGSDGEVWETNRNTAVKALGKKLNYTTERICYTRLKAAGVSEISGFSVPVLFGFDDELQVIEIEIVTPPFILDFGKVWLDNPPDYSPEAMEDSLREIEERFGENFPKVRSLLAALKFHGIYYMDAKPGNIAFAE